MTTMNGKDKMTKTMNVKEEMKEEAYDYYKRYAYQKGFSVRKGATKKSEKDGNVIGRRLFCAKEGFR
ncbi:hypothetical protein CCACVL1_25377 [Corchorus capsularis]|uniref:FAR1 domain-containing protein n=1 Tax=Corchorus capsularis TaxID=210143 RepID=A0A1R3GKY8_COCAP|nr:hypothetical protein CCACVL1_25377 [Corchorus capsularis]